MSNPKAFPTYEWVQSHGQMMAVGGMDLRDYFAAQVMRYWMSNPLSSMHIENMCTGAYQVADAMMKARELCSDTK